MSSHADTIRDFHLTDTHGDWDQGTTQRALETLDELLAEREKLRDALIAMREVAGVANEGDPWYCENEDVDAGKAFALARAALGEAIVE